MGKAAPAEANDAQKMVPADCFSVLLMAVDKAAVTKAQYDMMSALDGSRTASSFEHQFRAITAKAKELKARVNAGEKFKPVQPTMKRGGTSARASAATPKKRKNSSDEDGTPSRKKATAKGRSKNAVEMSIKNLGGGGDDLPEDMEDFIKHEQEWENDFA